MSRTSGCALVGKPARWLRGLGGLLIIGATLMAPVVAGAAESATPEGGPQSPNPTTTPQSDISTASTAPDAPPVNQDWAIHGQSTFTEFYQPAFRSPYRGQQSLDPGSRGRQTWDVTLYGGVRPWANAEIWVNPEVDQGFGPSNTFGLGGYVTAEAYKVGAACRMCGCSACSFAKHSTWAARCRR